MTQRQRIGVTLLALLLTLCQSQANGNIFQRTFQQLHEEPPMLTAQSRADAVQTLWIEQKLDHFDETETRTWQMVKPSKNFITIWEKLTYYCVYSDTC